MGHCAGKCFSFSYLYIDIDIDIDIDIIYIYIYIYICMYVCMLETIYNLLMVCSQCPY